MIPLGSVVCLVAGIAVLVLATPTVGDAWRTLDLPDVRSLAFSPTGNALAVASRTQVLLVDVDQGRVVQTLFGHTHRVAAVAFTSDGALLVSASEDSTARAWNLATGAEVRTFRHHYYGLTSCAISRDGRFLAAGTADRGVRLWELATGREWGTWRAHGSAVLAVAFSPHGRLVASGSSDREARVWEAPWGEAVTTLRGHTEAVTSVAFSPDGQLLATASADNTVRIWIVDTWRELRRVSHGLPRYAFGGQAFGVSQVCFSPDGRLLATASAGTNEVGIWEVASGRLIAKLGVTGPSAVAFSRDGTLLAVGYARGVGVWKVDELGTP